jgi:hypothetical protein
MQRYSKTHFYENRILSPGELTKAILSIAKLVPDHEEIRILKHQTLADDTHTSDPDLTLDDLETMLQLDSTRLYISFHSKTTVTHLEVNGYGKYIEIAASSDRSTLPQALVQNFSAALAVKPIRLEFTDAVSELTSRVEYLERKITSPKERLKCFLSYRFDPAVEGLAQKLERFLALLDVDVVTGAGYEPRSVVAKIRDKLGSSDLDFLVLLISKNGESMWTRDEIAMAKVPVIPIVEDGAKFEPGLFGDLEYIRFSDGHIEESFIKLLEALKFIRLQKPSESNTQVAQSERLR